MIQSTRLGGSPLTNRNASLFEQAPCALTYTRCCHFLNQSAVCRSPISVRGSAQLSPTINMCFLAILYLQFGRIRIDRTERFVYYIQYVNTNSSSCSIHNPSICDTCCVASDVECRGAQIAAERSADFFKLRSSKRHA